MLSEHELWLARSDVDRWKSEDCEILRKTRVRNPNGTGAPLDTTAVTATVKCRRVPRILSPRERETAGATMARDEWLITVPIGTDVRDTDQVRVEGTVYEITGIMTPTDALQVWIYAVEKS